MGLVESAWNAEGCGLVLRHRLGDVNVDAFTFRCDCDTAPSQGSRVAAAGVEGGTPRCLKTAPWKALPNIPCAQSCHRTIRNTYIQYNFSTSWVL